MQHSPSALPVDGAIPALRQALASASSAILVAEPGAGKTTRVPLALLDEAWLKDRRIIMLEPRRLAARSAARRMAQSLDEAIGATVGYTVRHERRVSSSTRIEVVTEAVLTRRLQADPELSDIGLIIFDEFHERSIDADLGLALALDVQRSLRADLRILPMSATLDDERLSRHLGAAAVISASGRVFPVDVSYLGKTSRQSMAEDVARACLAALKEQTGSVLAFLPGESEIRRTAAVLQEMMDGSAVSIHPLYGSMSFTEQDMALKPAPEGWRKIVLATTIAETSLTIEGIGAVVDCGFKRRPRFDPASGMTSLDTLKVSRASAEQRRGRAGRLGPGICYRLWPEEENRALLPHDPPEILISDLAPLALELAAWGVCEASALPFLDAPPAASFAQARGLLHRLDALDGKGAITTLGRDMARAPLHPRLSHMVLRAADLGAGREAAAIAAFLSERTSAPRDAGADIGLRRQMMRGTERQRLQQAAAQIIATLSLGEDRAELSEGLLIALAYPDRIAQRRGGTRRYRFSGGGGGVLSEHDALTRQEWLAVALTDGASGDQRILSAAPLMLSEIETHFSPHITWIEEAGYDARTQSVLAVRQKRLGALILEDVPLTDISPAILASGLVEGVRAAGLAALPWTEATRNLQSRTLFLRQVAPDLGFPDVSDRQLMASLDEWLSPYLAGMTKLAHLARLDLLAILRSFLPYSLAQRMDDMAPRRLVLPNGSETEIDYTAEAGPSVRVRLQEMFGLSATPRIAGGRVPLRIEMLSPAGRAIAVTASLETFWRNAYPDVRSEMRGRYPKHFWPEDGASAQAVAPRKLR